MNRLILAISALALAGLACTLSTDGPSGVTIQPAAAVPTQAPTAIPAPTAAPAPAGYSEYQCAPATLPDNVSSMRCFVIDARMGGVLFYTGNRLTGIGTIGPSDASDSEIKDGVNFVVNNAGPAGWNMDDLFAAGAAIDGTGVPVIRGTVAAALYYENGATTAVYFLVEIVPDTGVSA